MALCTASHADAL